MEFMLLPATPPLTRYSARIASGDPLLCAHQGALLGNEAGELVGIVTRGDVVRAFERSQDETLTVLDAGQTKLVVATQTKPYMTLLQSSCGTTSADYRWWNIRRQKKPSTTSAGQGFLARQCYHHEETSENAV